MKAAMLRRVNQDGELYVRGKIPCRVAQALIRTGELEMKPRSGYIGSMGGAAFVRRPKPRINWRDAMRHEPVDELD
jgi:hypothetical protein